MVSIRFSYNSLIKAHFMLFHSVSTAFLALILYKAIYRDCSFSSVNSNIDCVAVFAQARIWFFLPSFYHQCHPHDKVSQALSPQIFTCASSMVIRAQGGESLHGNEATHTGTYSLYIYAFYSCSTGRFSCGNS